MRLNFDFAEAAEAFACFAKPSAYIQADLYEPERDEYEQMLGGKAREELVAADFGMSSNMTRLSQLIVDYGQRVGNPP